MSEELSIEIDKKTYAKLKKLANTNECTVNEEVGTAFTAAYEDLDDSVFDEIAIMEKRDSVLLILPADLYDSFQEEADNNSTSIEDELNVFFEEHLAASAEESEGDSSESENESEGSKEESQDDSGVSEAEASKNDENSEDDEEDEAQSIVIDKEVYIKLKKLADANECSINEEIGKAFSAAYEDMDDATLEKIDVMPRKDTVYVLLPKDLYDSFQEEADKNSTEIEEELKVFFEEHLAASGKGSEEESEEGSEEEETEAGSENEESTEEDASEDEEESDDEKSRAKKPENKGLFGMITESVGEFVEDLIGGAKKDHKKKKDED